MLGEPTLVLITCRRLTATAAELQLDGEPHIAPVRRGSVPSNGRSKSSSGIGVPRRQASSNCSRARTIRGSASSPGSLILSLSRAGGTDQRRGCEGPEGYGSAITGSRWVSALNPPTPRGQSRGMGLTREINGEEPALVS